MQDENTLGHASGATVDMPMIGKAPLAQGGLAPGKAASSAKTPGRKAFGNITNLKGRQPHRPCRHRTQAPSCMIRWGLADSPGCVTALDACNEVERLVGPG